VPRLVAAALLAVASVQCAPADCPPAVAAPVAMPPSLEDRAPATESQVMVVATIHKGHLVQAGYPLAHLRHIVEVFRPDLVLVEIRPEPFARGNFEDGPFEMTYVVEQARTANIPVAPIDWWREDEVGIEPAMDPMEQASLAAELADAPEPRWPAFDVVNGPAERRRMLRALNAVARHAGGNPIWTRRQAHFHRQALAAIEAHEAKRVLAFVGANHAPELEAHLECFGVAALDPRSIPVEPAAVDEKASSAVVAHGRAGVARLEATATTLVGVQRRMLDKKVHYFTIAIAREGRCCVAESELDPDTARNH
jgi:hypothetical protein